MSPTTLLLQVEDGRLCCVRTLRPRLRRCVRCGVSRRVGRFFRKQTGDACSGSHHHTRKHKHMAMYGYCHHWATSYLNNSFFFPNNTGRRTRRMHRFVRDGGYRRMFVLPRVSLLYTVNGEPGRNAACAAAINAACKIASRYTLSYNAMFEFSAGRAAHDARRPASGKRALRHRPFVRQIRSRHRLPVLPNDRDDRFLLEQRFNIDYSTVVYQTTVNLTSLYER